MRNFSIMWIWWHGIGLPITSQKRQRFSHIFAHIMCMHEIIISNTVSSTRTQHRNHHFEHTHTGGIHCSTHKRVARRTKSGAFLWKSWGVLLDRIPGTQVQNLVPTGDGGASIALDGGSNYRTMELAQLYAKRPVGAGTTGRIVNPSAHAGKVTGAPLRLTFLAVRGHKNCQKIRKMRDSNQKHRR